MSYSDLYLMHFITTQYITDLAISRVLDMSISQLPLLGVSDFDSIVGRRWARDLQSP